jgi:NADH-quinone oxidoreductase subunit E/NADP-reducing hydrogenase subunit HndA
MGTACYGRNPQIIEKAKQTLGASVGDTPPDGAITLEICRRGARSHAPAVVIDEEVKAGKPNKFPQLMEGSGLKLELGIANNIS